MRYDGVKYIVDDNVFISIKRAHTDANGKIQCAVSKTRAYQYVPLSLKPLYNIFQTLQNCLHDHKVFLGA